MKLNGESLPHAIELGVLKMLSTLGDHYGKHTTKQLQHAEKLDRNFDLGVIAALSRKLLWFCKEGSGGK